MAKGGRAIVEKSRRGISRWKGDEDEEEDEEYIAEEEEELESESYDESLASSSDSEEDGGEFGGNLEEFSGSDGSVEEDSDFEVDESEFDEEEEIPVKSSTKGRKKSRKTQTKTRKKVLDSEEDDEDFDFKPVSNQNRRKQSRKTESDGSDYEEEEDEDFDDLDEDEDFTPDVEDEDEESVSISKRRNGYKERARRSHAKRARKNKTSKVSRRKKPTVTKNKKEKNSRKKRSSRRKRSSPKEPAPKRRRRSAQMEDDDFIVDDDDDFILEDRAEPDKKNNKRKPVSDSDTSEFEFITSDEDDFITEEQIGPKKRKKNNTFCSESGSGSDSSDSDFVIYDEEVVKEVRKRKREDVKGKEKEGDKEDDSGKKMCGICLSEEQRRTTRGVLDCCAHFFCFACIVEWSKVESRCPVCKRRFETITKASSSDSDCLGFGAPRKVIKVPKRDQVYQPSEEDIRGMLDPYENVVCMECQQGGDDNLMLLCDICDSSAHTYCVGLGNAVPEGNWYCDCCRSAGVGPSNLQPQPSVGSIDPSPTESDPLVNQQPMASSSSALEIDLNAPPRDILEEASTQVLGGPSQVPSPSTGGAATLSGRRAIQNRIRILLSSTRPSQVVRRNIEQENSFSNGVRPGLRVGRSVGQQGSILAPHGERGGPHDADNAKEQVRSMVKNHVKQLCSNTLDRDAYKDVVKRATYTVLAACGLRDERRNLVSNSIPAPTSCHHEIHHSGQASLLAGSCSTCFDSFVRNAVSCILSRD